jgi:hypothetical protein
LAKGMAGGGGDKGPVGRGQKGAGLGISGLIRSPKTPLCGHGWDSQGHKEDMRRISVEGIKRAVIRAGGTGGLTIQPIRREPF